MISEEIKALVGELEVTIKGLRNLAGDTHQEQPNRTYAMLRAAAVMCEQAAQALQEQDAELAQLHDDIKELDAANNEYRNCTIPKLRGELEEAQTCNIILHKEGREFKAERDRYREALRLAKASACRCNEEGRKCSLCNAMESTGLESSAEYWRTVPRQSLNPKEPKGEWVPCEAKPEGHDPTGQGEKCKEWGDRFIKAQDRALAGCPPKEDCPDCGGSGEEKDETGNHYGSDPCPKCEGTGIVYSGPFGNRIKPCPNPNCPTKGETK